MISQLSRTCSKLGVQVDVLSTTPHRTPSKVEIDGYRIHRVRSNIQIASTNLSLLAIQRFAALIKMADVIHYHFPWPLMDVAHFAARVKIPTVLTYHSDIVRQNILKKLYKPLQCRFFESISCIVATSPNYVTSSSVLAKYANKIRVIPIGLDKATYSEPSLDKLTYWRERFGPKFFLFVGAFRYYKGLNILLEAAQGIEYPIVIVGSGPIERELKTSVSQLGLSNVHFLGSLSDEDRDALLILCLGIVFPSNLRSEAFGISLLEGAMYGKPMISSEIGTGTSFINIDGETGLVVPPDDSVSLRRAMKYLWEHPIIAAVMGRAAEKRYWKLFTANQMAQSYIDLYHEVA